MTLIEILNDPKLRRKVDAIDDTWSSLKGREDDPTLNGIIEQQIADLKQKTGFKYDPRQ